MRKTDSVKNKFCFVLKKNRFGFELFEVFFVFTVRLSFQRNYCEIFRINDLDLM